MLAYHLLNHAACKTCNTPLKSNHFPIAGKRRRITAASPELAKSEQQLLIYPIGSGDVDPKDVVTFDGLKSTPVAAPNTHAYRRAQVVIDFFELDTREHLLRERAERVHALWMAAIVGQNRTATQKTRARNTMMALRLPSAAHSACVNAFFDLMQTDRPRADQLFQAIDTYLSERSSRYSGEYMSRTARRSPRIPSTAIRAAMSTFVGKAPADEACRKLAYRRWSSIT